MPKMFWQGLENLQTGLLPLVITRKNQGGEIIARHAALSFALPSETTIESYVKLCRELFDFIQANVDYSLAAPFLEKLFLDGMLKDDQYSFALTPGAYRNFRTSLKGSYYGVGMVIGIRNHQLIIVSPFPGSPAERAGLQGGDIINQVNGISTLNMSVNEASARIRGPEGTYVKLRIGRDNGTKERDFRVKREKIELKNVESTRLAEDKIGYIKIKRFEGNTDKEVKKHLLKLHGGKIKGLIIDLRNNSGGLLSQAIRVTDMFLTEGVIVSTYKGNPISTANLKMFRAANRKIVGKDIPLVVLINKGTASGAEIMAGALKVNRQAILVGTNSFGKGTVQEIFRLNHGLALRITTALFRVGDKRFIHSRGIAPHLTIKEVDMIRGIEISMLPDRLKENSSPTPFDHWAIAEEKKDAPLLRVVKISGTTKMFQETRKKNLQDRLAADFEVEVAQNILLQITQTQSSGQNTWPSQYGNRNKIVPLLQGTVKAVDKIEKEQEEKLKKLLAKREIDWRSNSKDKGCLGKEALIKQKRYVVVKSGQCCQGNFTIFNRGKTLNKLIVLTKSNNPWLNSREILVGALKKGQNKSVTWPMYIPTRAESREPITLKIYDQNLCLVGESTFYARVKSSHTYSFQKPLIRLEFPGEEDVKNISIDNKRVIAYVEDETGLKDACLFIGEKKMDCLYYSPEDNSLPKQYRLEAEIPEKFQPDKNWVKVIACNQDNKCQTKRVYY